MSSAMKSLALLLTLASLTGNAAPVPASDQVPIDLRRTTLIVSDMDASLALYRDAIGMKVIYDNMVRRPADATTNEEADTAIHLVFLRANDDFVGILGLMHYQKPRKAPAANMPEPFDPGSIVLLFNTDDVDAGFERLRQVPGVEVLSEPRDTSYPSYDGKTRIPARVSIVVDPDGHIVEYNQLKMDPREMLGSQSP